MFQSIIWSTTYAIQTITWMQAVFVAKCPPLCSNFPGTSSSMSFRLMMHLNWFSSLWCRTQQLRSLCPEWLHFQDWRKPWLSWFCLSSRRRTNWRSPGCVNGIHDSAGTGLKTYGGIENNNSQHGGNSIVDKYNKLRVNQMTIIAKYASMCPDNIPDERAKEYLERCSSGLPRLSNGFKLHEIKILLPWKY